MKMRRGGRREGALDQTFWANPCRLNTHISILKSLRGFRVKKPVDFISQMSWIMELLFFSQGNFRESLRNTAFQYPNMPLRTILGDTMLLGNDRVFVCSKMWTWSPQLFQCNICRHSSQDNQKNYAWI